MGVEVFLSGQQNGPITHTADANPQLGYSLRDSKGNEHLLDPDYIGTDFLLLQKSKESRQIFSALAPSRRIEILDKRWQDRINLVTQLIEDGRIHDNPKDYDYFSKDLADPGIAHRADELVSFGKQLLDTNPNITPWQLRELFSSHLGKIKIFRGMVLIESEMRSMMSRGIEAPGFQNMSRARQSMFDTFDSRVRESRVRYANSPDSEIAARLTDFYDADTRMFISVSKYQEIASLVGYHDSGKVEDQNRRLYVFEIEIPEISILRKQGLFQQENSYGKEIILSVGSSFRVNETNDLGVEMFVPYKINPNNILKVTRYDSPPPKWERHIQQ